MEKEICSRLKKTRLTLGLNQQKFADRLQIKQTHLSAIELGKLNVTISILKILSSEYKINLNWLISGNGSMFSDKDERIKIDDIILRLEEYKQELKE